ncbi:hypothetical protein ACFQLX_07075 [Streptomyces polyrhachis]|uniref:Uncharacterized protein n=1 Tax=Streptomyces polyrhachis TaxID=1282885 RepID=A0ABW2GAU4_9ACTN
MLARLRQARHFADVDLVELADGLPTALVELRRAAGRDLGDFFSFNLDDPRSLVQGVEILSGCRCEGFWNPDSAAWDDGEPEGPAVRTAADGGERDQD